MENLIELLAVIGAFGFVPLTVWVANKAKLDRLKIERDIQRNALGPQDASVLAELKAMRQQMEQVQSTSHQLDISFDEALGRLEGRINRLETKSAASTIQTTDTPQTLRNGQSQ